MRFSEISSQKGFTLLELIVVIFIIGLIVSVVGFQVIQPNPADKTKEEVLRFNVLVDIASEYAILNQRELGVYVDTEKNTYEFLVLDNDNRWLPLEGHRFLTKRELTEDYSLTLKLDGLDWLEDQFFDREIFDEELSVRDASVDIGEEDELPPPPQIMIMSSGELTPFELRIDNRTPEDGPPYTFTIFGRETVPLEFEGPVS